MASTSSAVRGPDVGVEDLDLDVAVVAGGVDGGAQRREVDVPVAHHAAAEQHVGGQRRHPVADLEGGDPVAGAGDLARRRRGPTRRGRCRRRRRRAAGTARRGRAPGPASRARRGRRSTSGAAARAPAARPRRRRTGASSATASATRWRAPGRSREPVGQPADHQHEACRVPSVGGLVDRAPVVVQRRRRRPVVKKPPRHSDDTRRPASATSCAAASSPCSATCSRHRPIAGMPARDAAVDGLAHASSACVVIWLSDSRVQARGRRS